MKFAEGDVVSRKISSQLMTVENLRTDALIACVWHDREGHVQRDCFAAHTLNKWQLVEDAPTLPKA